MYFWMKAKMDEGNGVVYSIFDEGAKGTCNCCKKKTHTFSNNSANNNNFERQHSFPRKGGRGLASWHTLIGL